MYSDNERQADFDFFVENYDALFKRYGKCYIAIRNKEILGVYKSSIDAVRDLLPVYEIGSYILQECNGDASAYTTYVASFMITGESA